jgi:tetratricopeptide (TPR) repeat protein
MTRTLLLATTLALIPALAMGVGSDDDTPPTTTSTTTECQASQIWDEKAEACLDAVESRFNDTNRYDAVRELAYAGAFDRAMAVLDTFENALDDGRLTYLGLVSRKMGDEEAGMAWYQAALVQNSDNLLARSYMGQAYVTAGDAVAARAQLREIRRRGGRETWPERSLELALRGGPALAY